MSKVKDENYYQISGWMINKLKLKGNALNIYAIIYGFTQDGESIFTGSRQYLCDFTGATKPTIDRALDELVDKQLIIKTTETINNVLFNKYRANLNFVDFTTGKETLLPDKEILQVGGKETLPNNINIDNKDNNIKNKKETELNTILNQIENEKLKETLIEFVKMRKSIKKPMTTHALELLIKKLNKITMDIDIQILILEKSILNGWQDVYAPKEEIKQNNFIKNSYTKEQTSSFITDLDNVEL
jgi:hypothetical protein